MTRPASYFLSFCLPVDCIPSWWSACCGVSLSRMTRFLSHLEQEFHLETQKYVFFQFNKSPIYDEQQTRLTRVPYGPRICNGLHKVWYRQCIEACKRMQKHFQKVSLLIIPLCLCLSSDGSRFVREKRSQALDGSPDRLNPRSADDDFYTVLANFRPSINYPRVIE